MGKFIFDISMSVDGYVNGPNDRPEEGLGAGGEALHGWVTDADPAERQLLDDLSSRVGAAIIGGRTFDNSIQSWGGKPPSHVPFYVLTGDAGRAAHAEQCGFRIAGEGIASAIAAAREAAGPDKDVVMIGGAAAARSALNAGLVDEMRLHIAPVFLGAGTRLFDGIDADAAGLRQDGVVATTNATHIMYVVEPRR